MASYEKVADLVSRVRNARYGEMVKYLETLIDSGDWRDFTTPAGTRFQFRECEFDYFLLAMEVDPTTTPENPDPAVTDDRQSHTAPLSLLSGLN
jgi:hypothetical protein